jgi:hypothetical protein
MSATTLDVIIDRVRSICVELPFEYVETLRFDSFELLPAGAIDGAFRVEGATQQVRGNFNYMEERTDLLTVTVARPINADFDSVRRELTRAAQSLTSAIVRDGVETTGLFTVADRGRAGKVIADPTNTFVELRLTLPVNYEAQL